MKASRTTVAISGLHRGENPQPGAAVIRSLRRRFSHIRVIGLSYDSLESALFSGDEDAADVVYSMPFPGVGPDALLDRLDAIGAVEPIDMIIPCLDAELSNFLAIEPALKERGVRVMLPESGSFRRRDKVNLPALCAELQILAPLSRIVHQLPELFVAAEQFGYPLYVKGRLYEARLVTNAQQLALAFDELVLLWGAPVVVQRPIAGEEYDFVGLGDGKGGILGRCTIRKMLKTKAGKAFAGVVVADPELDRVGEKIVAALRWRGPFELEFIRTSTGYALIEINPRFPAWVDFPSQLGCNLPNAMAERMMGTPTTPIAECLAGRLFIRHCVDLVGDIADVAEIAAKGVLTGRRAANLRLVNDVESA